MNPNDHAGSRECPECAKDELLKEWLDRPLPEDAEARMRKHLGTFRKRLAAREVLAESRWGRPWPVWRTFAAAMCAAMITAVLAPLWSGATRPTWGQVVKRFDSSPEFHATLYVKADGNAAPGQLELWMGRGGKLRLHTGNRVLFGEKGKIVEAVEIMPGVKEPENLATAQEVIEEFITNIGETESFSFDTLVNALPWKGELSASLPSSNPSIAKDMAVFDLTNESGGSDWVRVWALRESRLPIHLLYWNPANAASIDVNLDYDNPQSPAFFDPAQFRKALEQPETAEARKAYRLFSDMESPSPASAAREAVPTAAQ